MLSWLFTDSPDAFCQLLFILKAEGTGGYACSPEGKVSVIIANDINDLVVCKAGWYELI